MWGKETDIFGSIGINFMGSRIALEDFGLALALQAWL